MPRIAIESKGNISEFFKLFKERLTLAKDVIEWRYNRLITLKAKEAPFTYIGGVLGMTLDPEETVEKVYADGRGSLSIGYIGLYETALLLCGEDAAYSLAARSLQKEIMLFMNDTVNVFKKESSLGIGVYGSPSESLTDRFCRLDKTEFGSIKGVTDKDFYVNSFHANTEAIITPFEKIDIESELQPLSAGGHVMFVEMSNAKDNTEAYETYVRYAYEKKLMYFAVNSSWDFCKTCHWNGELKLEEETDHKYKCPHCGEDDPDKVVLTRRLCGYLSTINKRPPVSGRVKEIKSRVKHSK